MSGESERRPDSAPGSPGWEGAMLRELAEESLRERRRARRWSVAFRFALLAYLIVVLVLYAPLGGFELDRGPHTALVDVEGVIKLGAKASADNIVTGLRAAFEDEDTRGVIVRINSPGGSAVQSALVNDEMHRLREEHPEIPLYAVIGDLGASGGYYIAVGADRIYAARASLVGSIGVIMNGFGFVGTLDKLGVERRLIVAGEHKALLDPFSPRKPEEESHAHDLLAAVHRQFIDAVRSGRGDRLSPRADLFSGLIWSGEQAVDLGLVDGIGSAGYVAREVIGAERIEDFTVRGGLLERIGERLGASLGDVLPRASGVEFRAPWAAAPG